MFSGHQHVIGGMYPYETLPDTREGSEPAGCPAPDRIPKQAAWPAAHLIKFPVRRLRPYPPAFSHDTPSLPTCVFSQSLRQLSHIQILLPPPGLPAAPHC